MKVAIDARPLSRPMSGIGRYTTEIIKRLSNQVEFQFYAKRKLCFFDNATDLFWSPRHHLPLFGNRTPMVVTIHDLVYHLFPKTMKLPNRIAENLLLPPSVKKAQHIIAMSHATKDALTNVLTVPESKISVIYSGYIEFQTQKKQDLTKVGIHKPYILFLGTLEPRKNIERLVSAYLALPKQVQDSYQLILAGGTGWKSLELMEQIKNLNQKQVIHLGHVDDALIYNLYQQATCFAFPSLYEGFGLPILEAMSLGCPVLTSTDPACLEVSGDAAIQVDPLSVEAIANGLIKMLKDAKLRKLLQEKGQENCKRFSWDKAAKQHLDVFQQLI